MLTQDKSWESISLDWDNYCYFNINNHRQKIYEFLKASAEHIAIYESEKGLNLVIRLKNPVNTIEMFFIRGILYDDLFRQRNDVRKYWDNQMHRINRIWLVKNGFEKRLVFSGKGEQLTSTVYEDVLELLKSKVKKESETKND